jgi:NAD(P)-dependent dehydrogenase (short-subunit alcohol dehydrogenase family)
VEAKRVLVTGGTSGLGLAMADALARSGAAVAVTSRSAGRAAEAAARLPGAIGIECDARDDASVARAVEEAWSRLGGIDMLVNNAGIGMRTVNPRFLSEPQPFWKVSPDGFRAVVDTNLTGYFLAAREVTPRMLVAGHGRIVNISMNHATMTRAGFVPYGPSRAGAESLSRIMAADLRGTGVTVNMLLPGGATRTGMVPPGAGDRPLLDPDVMGPPIVWLASAEAGDAHDERIVATEFADWLRQRQAEASSLQELAEPEDVADAGLHLDPSGQPGPGKRVNVLGQFEDHGAGRGHPDVGRRVVRARFADRFRCAVRPEPGHERDVQVGYAAGERAPGEEGVTIFRVQLREPPGQLFECLAAFLGCGHRGFTPRIVGTVAFNAEVSADGETIEVRGEEDGRGHGRGGTGWTGRSGHPGWGGRRAG